MTAAPVLNSQRWRRLIPLAFITYSFAYLDRSNYSLGPAGGLKHALHITEAGATVHVLSLDGGAVRGYHYIEPGDALPSDGRIADADPGGYDLVVIPDGLDGPDALRNDADTLAFAGQMASAEKPIGVICHGPLVLIDAELLGGRTLTCVPALRSDVQNPAPHIATSKCTSTEAGSRRWCPDATTRPLPPSPARSSKSRRHRDRAGAVRRARVAQGCRTELTIAA